MEPPREVTQLLNQWTRGDNQAAEKLSPLIYDELHRIAARMFRSENKNHTLQPTALVHEAYAKLVLVDISWQDRAHFFTLAARMMRRLLVNHANAKRAEKRGGGAIRVTLVESRVSPQDGDASLLELDEALTRFSELFPRQADLVQLQYFGGLTFREMEEVTGLSSSTLDRDLRFARAWLKDQMSS